jgi:NDP-sugar pyrophosphorylase family protein
MMLPVAILAGGLATRLGPLTQGIPKSLVDVDGVPFAVHQIALLRNHGVTDIVFLIGHLGNLIQERLGDGSVFGVRLRYVADGGRPLGTGGAVQQALSVIGDACLVLYGDSYLDCDYRAVQDAFLASGKRALMTVCRNDNRWDASNVLYSGGRIVRYDKRQPTSEMRHIDYGLGAFRRTAFDPVAESKAFDLADVYERLLEADDLAAFEVPGRFYEIGSPAGLAETRAYLLARGVSTP